MFPLFVSACVQLVQTSTVASVIAFDDLLEAALKIETTTGNASPLVAATLAYLVLLLPPVMLARRYERRQQLAL
jgi:polar amino acid transport system permease protein